MTQEDKELLLKDLCARSSYGVKVLYEGQVKEIQYIEPLYNEVKLLDPSINYTVPISNLKPYLRPMSSMTDEEVKYKLSTFFHIINTNIEGVGYYPTLNSPSAIKYIDWLNAHHFDYRGLIERGLAIEVTKENNPYKNELS